MEFSRSDPIGFALLVGTGLAVLLLLSRRSSRLPGARDGTLLALRAAALAVLVFILLDPVRLSETRQPGRKPEAIFLIDSSRSMGLEEPVSRLDQTLALIVDAESQVPEDRRSEITRYRFGRGLAALPRSERPRAVDDETRLSSALERLPERFGDSGPWGVFVFSDGRVTEPDGLAGVAQGYSRLGVPIHVVPIGRAAGDVAVQDIVAPRDAPPGGRVPVTVVVRSRGYAGRRAEVCIRAEAGPGGPPLASLPVTLADGEQAYELVIEAGRATTGLVAEVPPLADEATSENNQVPFRVALRQGKVRVIYMEGGPFVGSRRLSEALAEDPNIECLDVGLLGRIDDRPRLIRRTDPNLGYPATRQELFTYDVIICSDIPREGFTPEQLAWTVELVGERGGGFAMVGGNKSFGAGQYHETAWNGLIPVDMGDWGLERGFGNIIYWGRGRTFRVVVPPEARGHAIWRIVEDPARNRDVLGRMPTFYGCNLVERLKPGAVLLGHSDHPLLQAGRAPIFSCQSYGRGRSFAMLTDTTPDWGADFERLWGEGDNRYFRKFWRNVVSWLAENSVGRSRRLRVEADKLVYRPGEPIRLAATAFDEALDATDRYRLTARMRLSREQPGTGQAVALSPRTEVVAYEGMLTAPTLDPARPETQGAVLEVVASDGERLVAQAEVEIQVRDDPAEYRDPRPDETSLAALARNSGGRVVRTPHELAVLLQAAPRAADRVLVSRSPIWDRPLVWALLLGLLAAEWVLRRRSGLA